MILRLLKLSVLTTAITLTVGCASTQDLEAVRTMAAQAQADASAANATANNALAVAEEARTIANEALTASRATDERLNRMFKRAMLK
jgi:murein lipoprotein